MKMGREAINSERWDANYSESAEGDIYFASNRGFGAAPPCGEKPKLEIKAVGIRLLARHW